MEAPKKLYLHPTANGKVGASWLAFPLTNEDVEYIRKDTFIEKACGWIKEKWDDNYTMPIIIDSVIEDFQNYMKGE